MSSRERWISAIQCKPVDRLPFWPKVFAGYIRVHKDSIGDKSVSELHKWIGSDQYVGCPSCVRTVRKKTKMEQNEKNGLLTTLYHTPAGILKSIMVFDESSDSWHPREYPVKTPDDITAMRLFISDEKPEFDEKQYESAEKVVKEIGEDGVVCADLGISPLMDWIQHIAGVENGLMMLFDYREEVEGLFDAMHKNILRRAEIIADKCPCPVIQSTENTSTTLISPELFRKYCQRHLEDYGRVIRQAGKFHILHQCGHLKALLPDITELPASGIEAFTSPPVGNTTLLDGRKDCPDKCLIGGTNATLWLESAEDIMETIERDLDVLPHHRGIVITSAGVMPPACRPETIRAVAEAIRNYRMP